MIDINSFNRSTPFGDIVQFAFHAPNIELAATEFATLHQAGPFYLFEHIPLQDCYYRGKLSTFDHSSAYGQYNEVMIELIHDHNDAPSPVRDMFGPNEPGLHHAAIFVADIDQALRAAKSQQMECALDATTMDGTRFTMVDARKQMGFMLEFYAKSPALERFYGFIRRKAAQSDGSDILRRL